MGLYDFNSQYGANKNPLGRRTSKTSIPSNLRRPNRRVTSLSQQNSSATDLSGIGGQGSDTLNLGGYSPNSQFDTGAPTPRGLAATSTQTATAPQLTRAGVSLSPDNAARYDTATTDQINYNDAQGAADGSSWSGQDVGSVLQGIGGLANAYTGIQGLELAKKQNAFQQGLANRNLANQGALINEDLTRKRGVGLALSGLSTEGRASYNAANPVTQVDTTAL